MNAAEIKIYKRKCTNIVACYAFLLNERNKQRKELQKRNKVCAVQGLINYGSLLRSRGERIYLKDLVSWREVKKCFWRGKRKRSTSLKK